MAHSQGFNWLLGGLSFEAGYVSDLFLTPVPSVLA